MEHIKAATDLAQRAGSFALSFPEHLDNLFGKLKSGGSIIAEPTSSSIVNTTIVTSSGTFVQESLPAGVTAVFKNQDAVGSMSPFQTLKNIGGFLSYMTSKWAIATFTIAIVLNRTQFYASSRIPLSFNRWHLRLVLYILPTIIFMYRIQWLLQAIRCQTSPHWSQLQYGVLGKELDTDFAGEGGLLWRVSSALLFWEEEQASCVAAGMMPRENDVLRPAGSLAILWPLFVSLGFSQFIETLACALQSRQPVPETGMTIFEHSLAFAEAEAVVTRPFSLNASTLLKSTTLNTPNGTPLTLSHSAIIQIANVPPEVLVISLISSLSHLSSNLLAIIGLRAKLRLISTGIWGLAYMSAFVWSFIRAANIAESSGAQIGVLRFPTVCIVGFIPHLLILVGIVACGAIYALAFVLTALSPPPGNHGPSSLTDRLRFAYGNLQANIHLSTITPIRINWQEDFYTFILKCGFTVLTAASEAVYLNEGTRVTVSPLTWLEEKRLQEVIDRRGLLQQTLNLVPAEPRSDAVAEGVGLIDQTDGGLSVIYEESGYARERRTRGANSTSDASRTVGRESGVGLQQRRGRWTSTYQFLKGIFWLVMTLHAKATIAILQRLRITYRPAWLLRLAGTEMNRKRKARNPIGRDTHTPKTLDFWMINDEGQLSIPSNTSVDVEAESRRRLEDAGFYKQDQEEAEEILDFNLYTWWKTGGWWGELDTSGDYEALNQDDDSTSVVSTAVTDEHDWSGMDDSTNSDSQRTPTQQYLSYSRDATPSDELISRLSSLLDPQTREQQEEARFLARHLQSQGVLTRSKYRKAIERDQNRLLTSSRYRPNGMCIKPQSTPEEEERLLEQFILERRNDASNNSTKRNNATWDAGAEGMGAGGPQCVVCQLTPRTILVWPCGCLSLCDDCRVGLASRNYTSCVCCRTNVVAYSRLYVP